MSAPAFTPGPWEIVLPVDNRDCDVEIRAPGGTIAEVCAPFRSPDDGGLAAYDAEAKANANLMATAPKLYEACEALLSEWDRLTQYGSPMAKAANERVAFARRVMAEARGEQP